jgi:hypothetical protein
MDCTAQNNAAACTCTYEPCSRKGRCCACIAYHRQSGELPGCLFPTETERTYDRSAEAFVAAFRKRGTAR